MAYKRQSPLPIVEGGSNAQSLATTDGVIYFDGTRLVTTAVGTAGQVLTSQGAGSPPIFQSMAGAGTISIISTGGRTSISSGAGAGTSYSIPYSQEGSRSSGLTQTQSQFPIPVSGTLSNMYVYIDTNTCGDTNIILNINLVNTIVNIAVPGATTGILSDLVHSVAITAGDLIQFECTANGLMNAQVVIQITT